MTRTVGNCNAPEQEKCPDAKDSLKGKVGVAAHLVEQIEQQQQQQHQQQQQQQQKSGYNEKEGDKSSPDGRTLESTLPPSKGNREGCVGKRR